jgi:hypothetical protein
MPDREAVRSNPKQTEHEHPREKRGRQNLTYRRRTTPQGSFMSTHDPGRQPAPHHHHPSQLTSLMHMQSSCPAKEVVCPSLKCCGSVALHPVGRPPHGAHLRCLHLRKLGRIARILGARPTVASNREARHDDQALHEHFSQEPNRSRRDDDDAGGLWMKRRVRADLRLWRLSKAKSVCGVGQGSPLCVVRGVAHGHDRPRRCCLLGQAGFCWGSIFEVPRCSRILIRRWSRDVEWQWISPPLLSDIKLC